MITTLSADAQRYVERVRQLLDDLPEDELVEVVGDLEPHLIELSDTGSIRSALGTPEEFVSEFRTSAGLAGRAQSSVAEQLLVRARRLGDAIGAVPGVQWTRQQLREARPGWVLVRGGLAVFAFGYLYSGPDVFPVPHINGRLFGGVLVVAATAVSLHVGRSSTFGWRWIDRLTTTLVLSMLVAVAANWHFPAPNQYQLTGLWSNGSQITNIYTFTEEGKPLDAVLLYDQDGHPIEVIPFDIAGSYPDARIEWMGSYYGLKMISAVE